MPPAALGLLLTAAVLHATWNLLVKRAREKQIFTACALLVGAICFAPLLAQVISFPLRIWPYVISSAIFESTYFVVLIRAYANGDFSLVYPMARGTAPVLLTVLAVLFLGERPRLYGLIGIGILVCGLIIVGGKSWWTLHSLRKGSALSSSALILALGVACCISIYSAIDGAAVQQVAPLPYTVLVMGLTSFLIAPTVVVRYGGQAVIAEWRANWPRIILVGILSLLSYMLVLLAYSISQVSYAGSVREVSVVIGAFLGWRLLGEEFGVIRVIGAAFIFAGILVIAVAG
ncbi:MAG TPA: DMT family transporter [Ktedonobacteraceae bacterium]|jgi:drug/metabolite transporter (DMT)-like permease|nr:DMT family transporter [Ktedonobacteraceae bacterium]